MLAAGAAFAVWRFLPENTPPKSERPRGEWRESLALIGDRRLSAYLIYGFALSLVAGVTVQVFGLFTMDRLGVAGSHGAELTAAGFMVNALALLATQLAILPRIQARPARADGVGRGAAGAGRRRFRFWRQAWARCWSSQAVQGLGAGLARPGFTGGASIAVRPEEQGAAAGLVVAANGAGFVFSPLIGGVVYERVGMNAPLLITRRAARRHVRVRAAEPAAAQHRASVDAPPTDPTTGLGQ